jgi:hypothetical protein
MTKRSRHASGFWSITTDEVVVATTIFLLEFEFAMSSPFHRAPISTHRYRQLPALGSCYGVVVCPNLTDVNKCR